MSSDQDSSFGHSNQNSSRNNFWLNAIVGVIWGLFAFFLQFPWIWLAGTVLPQETVTVEIVGRDRNERTVHRRDRSHQYQTWTLSLRMPNGQLANIDVSKSVYEATHPVAMVGAKSVELSRTRFLKIPARLLVTRSSILGDQDLSLLKIDNRPRINTYDLRPEFMLVIGALALNIIFYCSAIRAPWFRIHHWTSVSIAALGFTIGIVVVIPWSTL
ncbi:MAG TPA: hypothetical protein PKD64_18440 [Pirellulaceae bacterium]|nr:hypothetical protein [Pirellulaceae bacterium]HMO94169.1 hypothetical protein [Pirellulaceae bacterium]HMP71292.1 hypothetical protein [Pirellulaceae bacterium]